MRKINTDFDLNKKPKKVFRDFTPKPFLIAIEGGLSDIKRTASANKSEKRLAKNFNYIIQK